MGMVRGVIRPKAGVRGVWGRGKFDGDGVARMGSLRDRISGQEFRDRKSREPHQVPRGARAIVVANNFDSHVVECRDL
jgi:hypothetical protein